MTLFIVGSLLLIVVGSLFLFVFCMAIIRIVEASLQHRDKSLRDKYSAERLNLRRKKEVK